LGSDIVGDPAAVINTDGRIEVFAVGSDGQTVYHTWQAAQAKTAQAQADATWSGLASLGSV